MDSIFVLLIAGFVVAGIILWDMAWQEGQKEKAKREEEKAKQEFEAYVQRLVDERIKDETAGQT